MDASILLTMALLLLFAKFFGEITVRLGVSSIVGEVLAGVFLATFFGITVGSFLNDFLVLGIIFLLFLAGLGVKFEDIKDDLYSASTLGAVGGLLSFAMGFLVGWIVFKSILIGIAIGTALVSTSNGVVFLMLMKSNEFKSRTGKMIVATAITDDIVGIMSLSFFTMFVAYSTVALSDIWFLLLVSVGFYLVILTAGSRIINKALNYGALFLDEQVLFTISIATFFVISIIAENINLGLATGAFLAGMAMAKSRYAEVIILPKVKIISDGFLIPIFLASIGASMAFKNIDVMLTLLILGAAVLGKVIGCGILSRIFGFRKDDAKMIGLFMIPRGDYNIIVAQIAISLGVITSQVFTSLVSAIILTIILAPILLKIFTGK